jgi:hypothetical protein
MTKYQPTNTAIMPDGDFFVIVKRSDAQDSDGQTGPMPSNVARFGGFRDSPRNDHLAIACLTGDPHPRRRRSGDVRRGRQTAQAN